MQPNKENILDFATLKETKKQLELNDLSDLASEIERILLKNRVKNTEYFLIDFCPPQIEIILSMLGYLKKENKNQDYIKIFDKWNSLPDYR